MPLFVRDFSQRDSGRPFRGEHRAGSGRPARKRTIVSSRSPSPHFRRDVPPRARRIDLHHRICFARNVESKLLDRGYRIPALDIFKREDFRIEPSALNKLWRSVDLPGTAWALDPEFPFVPEAASARSCPASSWTTTCRSASGRRRSRVSPPAARRSARTVAQVKDCRVIIITLGLTEAGTTRSTISTSTRIPA